jgi:hypothetical protein
MKTRLRGEEKNQFSLKSLGIFVFTFHINILSIFMSSLAGMGEDHEPSA